ncbi:MAG: reverse transcriptase family protein [Candidatus Pacebacteria bacterium]|nr:reverse transcriptase family protein [Candidatus Paceibacterota bacterium]
MEQKLVWFKMRVAFAEKHHFLSYISAPTIGFNMTAKHDLTKINTEANFIKYFLNLDSDSYMKLNVDRRTNNFVQQHQIIKRDGTIRIVWEVNKKYESLYKIAAIRLDSFFVNSLKEFPHPNVFGFVQGRNTNDNAKMHCGKKYLLKIDIKDFYTSIKRNMIEEFLGSLGVSEITSQLIAEFVCLTDYLTQGFATSPVISNAIFYHIDCDLKFIADTNNLVYSRYADDINFSGTSEIDILDQVKQLLNNNNFLISEKKTRYSKVGQAHFVTGLSINDFNSPHVPKKLKHKLRQEIYFAKKFGLESHIEHCGTSKTPQKYVNHLDGMVKYVSYHEQAIKAELRSDWKKILDKSSIKPRFKSHANNYPTRFTYIDESEITVNGNKHLAICFVVLEDQSRICDKINAFIDEKLANPNFTSNKDNLIKKGIHFSDSSQDTRKEFLELICLLPIDVYIGFSELNSPKLYSDVYLRVIRAMIKRRLISIKGRNAILFFEQNNKISKQDLQKEIHRPYSSLYNSNDPFPTKVRFEVVDKKERLLALPDYILGIFRLYVEPKKDETDETFARKESLFNTVSDKIRIIYDVDKRIEYTRRNPIENLID